MQHTSLVFIVHRGQNKCLSNSSFVSFTTKLFMSARTRCVSVMRMLVITHLFVSTHSSVMTIVKSRPFREKQGKILLEGRRLIADALKAGAVPKVFFFSRLEYIKELPIEKLKGCPGSRHVHSHSGQSLWECQRECGLHQLLVKLRQWNLSLMVATSLPIGPFLILLGHPLPTHIS